MGESVIAILSVCAFSLCFHFLLISLGENLKMKSFMTDYSLRALRMERTYKVLAWTVLTLLFFISTVMTMYKVYVHLNPFL